MRWLDRFTEDMTVTDAEAALRAESVEFEIDEGDEEDGPTLRFDADDFHYSIEFEPASKKVNARGVWRKVARDEALRLVLDGVGNGPVAVAAVREEQLVRIRWFTSTRLFVLSFHEHEQQVHLRCDCEMDEDDATSVRRECVEPDAYVSRLESLRRLLADAPTSEGDRGAAVERWRTHLANRHEKLARLVEIAHRLAPNAMFYESPLAELAEDLELFAVHAERFVGDDDWRDAIVVGHGEEIPYRDPDQFGWRVELAHEGITSRFDPKRRAVRLIEGPFAYGIHRVLRENHELYALRESWPVDQVVVEDPARLAVESDPEWLREYDPDWLRELGGCIATLGDAQLMLCRVNGDVERIATLLVCARIARDRE